MLFLVSYVESRATAIKAQTNPIPWSRVIDSRNMRGAAMTTTSGYRAVRGTMIEAFPPFRIAASRVQAPKAFKNPLKRVKLRARLEYVKTSLAG